MFELTYENHGSNSYLVYEIIDDNIIDSMSLGMITNNSIPGLASAVYMQMDTHKYIKYSISSKVSVRQFFEGPVNKKRFIGVFSGIVDALISAEDYMLDVNSFLLDLDYIFTDVSTCETELVCLPVINVGINNDLLSFFKNIVFSIQFDQTENCDYVAKVINYLNSASRFSVVEFKKLINTIMEEDNVTDKLYNSDGTSNNSKRLNDNKEIINTESVVEETAIKQVTNKKKKETNHENKMLIPGKPDILEKKDTLINEVSNEEQEEEVTLFELLSHYNKERKELYMAQRKKKKEQNSKNSLKPKKEKNKSKNKEKKAVNIPVPNGKSEELYNNYLDVQNTNVQEKDDIMPDKIPAQNESVGFGETITLGGNIGQTTVLSAQNAPQSAMPHLYRIKNREIIALNKPVFRIGKEKSYVDYFIGDNSSISRSHANIINRDGEYYIVDTNSTNHTFVNGGMIQNNVETKLSHGTSIRLSNEEFEFRMY